MCKHSGVVSVLLIDDDEEVLLSSTQSFEIEGFDVLPVDSANKGLRYLSDSWRGVVLTDVRMPGKDGFALLEEIQHIDAEIPVILVTGHGDVSMALRAIRAGAYDFIEKPADPEQLIEVVRRASERRNLILENRFLRERLLGMDSLEGRVIGRSEASVKLRQQIVELSDADVNVLIQGETGAGKEVVARSLHDFCSHRKDKPFVAVNCGALPDSLIESELFGHESGAFTGAQKARMGKLEYADGGTLFLDEIESMPLSAQVRILRSLQERVVERLGGNRLIPIDIRVIAATKVDLLDRVHDGEFREDLYYRLNVISLPVPPLRERVEDIMLLFHHFMDIAASRLKRHVPELGAELAGRLLSHSWPGNIRELRNVAERTVLGVEDPLANHDLTGFIAGVAEPLETMLERVERAFIDDALRRHQGRVGETAKALGILRKTLYLKMKKYNMDKEVYQ